jgi:murein DD-endopeptidase MepM/ murein hydrolase activator NlpD
VLPHGALVAVRLDRTALLGTFLVMIRSKLWWRTLTAVAAVGCLTSGPVPASAATFAVPARERPAQESPPAPSPAPSPASTGAKVERVRLVASLFGTQSATTAAKHLAGIAAVPLGSGDLPVTRPVPALPGDEAAVVVAVVEEHDLMVAKGDYFDPSAPSVAGSAFDALLPDNRQYLLTPRMVNGAVCPVPDARFWNDWGQPRSGGRVHTGTDLIAPYGSPIYALWDGTVTRVDTVDTFVPGVEADLGGVTVSYVGTNGTRVYNGHLASVPDTIRPGVTFSAGTVIGFVGDTGNASLSVPHLHIQVHPGGGPPVNPYPLLAEICI